MNEADFDYDIFSILEHIYYVYWWKWIGAHNPDIDIEICVWISLSGKVSIHPSWPSDKYFTLQQGFAFSPAAGFVL